MEEKIYTIRLMKAKMAPRTKKARKAIKIIKDYLAKHTKIENVRIDSSLNEAVWDRGLKKIPSKIRVKAVKREEEIWAYTPEAEIKIEEKKKEKAEEKKVVEEKTEKEGEEVTEETPEEEKEVEEKEEEPEEKAEEVTEEAKEIEKEAKEKEEK